MSFLGYYSECIDSTAADDQFTGQYCLANIHLPHSAITASSQRVSEVSPNSFATMNPRVGICVPSTCKLEETQLLTQKILSKIIVNATASFSSCYQRTESVRSGNKEAFYVIAVFVFVLLLFIIGTTYDFMTRALCSHTDINKNLWKNSTNTTTSVVSLTSVTTDSSEKRESIARQFLLAFSFTRNISKIFDTETSANSIDAIHGLRFLCMVWVITGHSYSFAMRWLFFRDPDAIKTASKSVLSQVFANSTFSVDCFFFISGFLLALLTFKQLNKKSGKMNYFAYCFHRYMRLTPLMLAIIGFSATILRYMGQGPAWLESIVMFDKWCRNNWWINALYLHNFINRENMCLSHSWYSAVDMQLYLIAPLILIPLYRRPKIGFSIIAAILMVSMGITAYLTLVKHYPAVPYFNDLVAESIVNEYYGAIYIKPYCRIGPYLVGIALGYLIYASNGQLQLKKIHNLYAWIAATCVGLAVILAMLPANAGHIPSDTVAALYSATSRTVWAACLAWVTFACVSGRAGFVNTILSWKAFVPLSRLTYSAYLIHPIVIAAFYGSRETTFDFSHYLMVYLLIGNLVITYAVSLVLSVMFESPFISIGKLFDSK
ncbi:Nose resistant to fluoxetine protein 6-like protein, partial [Leptotrombidium deliense]